MVYDAKTGEDLTRSILTQIILEEDSKGRNLLPINFLRQLIGYYDDSLRAFLPRYLELSMENFAANQEQIRRYIEGTFGQFFPLGQFEDMARQNMALFQRAATMFTPPKSSGNAADGPGDEDRRRAPRRRCPRAPTPPPRSRRSAPRSRICKSRSARWSRPRAQGVSGLATTRAAALQPLRWGVRPVTDQISRVDRGSVGRAGLTRRGAATHRTTRARRTQGPLSRHEPWDFGRNGCAGCLRSG